MAVRIHMKDATCTIPAQKPAIPPRNAFSDAFFSTAPTVTLGFSTSCSDRTPGATSGTGADGRTFEGGHA